MPWSTPAVLKRIVAEAGKRGLSIHLLPSWYDVDRPDDLDRLARELDAEPSAVPGYPQRTADAVARLLGAETRGGAP